MSTIDVTTSAQQLYPFGDQDAFIITNNGPFTVFLDSDSSVSDVQSYPLLPTGSIAWDSGRPLWVRGSSAMGAASSQIVLTRNSAVASFNTGIMDSVLSSTQYDLSGVGSTPLIEATAWSTLILSIKNLSSNAYFSIDPLGGTTIYGAGEWVDSELNVIANEAFTVPIASSVNGGGPYTPTGNNYTPNITIAFPVKARYFRVVGIRLGDGSPSSQFAQLNVIGTTQAFKPYMKWTAWNGRGIHTTPSPLSSGSGPYTDTGSDGYSFDIGMSGWPGLYLSSVSRKLYGTIRPNEAVATAGSIAFRSAFNFNVVHAANVAIPVGGLGQVIAFQVDLPIYTPTLVSFGPAPKNATPANITTASMKLWWGE